MAKIFISHASEDKKKIVRRLANKLRTEEVTVWYDEFSLILGDSLRDSIDRGLKEADYGLVILSPDFFNKNWTIYELDSLVAIEMVSSKKMIIPIWHNVEHKDVLNFSPRLADKYALKSSQGLKKMVTEILNAISPKNSQPIAPQPIAPQPIAPQPFIDSKIIIELLNNIKTNTKYLWPGLFELNNYTNSVSEEIRESTLKKIQNSIDQLQEMGLFLYEVNFSYTDITKKKVFLIKVFNISTQLKNLIKRLGKNHN